MHWRDRIEQNPEVMLGKPVIRGTRITVEHLLEKLGSGWSDTQILESYPHLKVDDIRAALSYAAQSLSSDETILLAEISR